MKKSLYYVVATLLLLTSCAELLDVNNPIDLGQKRENVSFRPRINPSTRATDLEFEQGDKISVFASEGTVIQDSNYAENVEYVYDNGLFTTQGTLIYPDEQRLAFYAVYPYDVYTAPSFNFYVNTDQSTHEKYTESDLMTASNVGYDNEVVDLDFYHRLSKVVINLNSENMPAGQQSVTFKNVYYGAQANLSSNSYNTISTERADIVASPNGTNSFKAILPPQTIVTGDVFVEITIGDRVFQWEIDRNLIFNSGVEYTYTLYFNTQRDNVQFSSYINSWNEPSVIEAVVPQEYIEIIGEYIPIHEGTTPPSIEGIYLLSPATMLYDSQDNFSPGYEFVDVCYNFYNQSSNNTLSMYSTQNLGDLSAAEGVFISGNGQDFTVYFNQYTAYDNGDWLTRATIISGRKNGDNIDDLHTAFIIIDKYDQNDTYMDVGDYRVIYDGDYTSEPTEWPLNSSSNAPARSASRAGIFYATCAK